MIRNWHGGWQKYTCTLKLSPYPPSRSPSSESYTTRFCQKCQKCSLQGTPLARLAESLWHIECANEQPGSLPSWSTSWRNNALVNGLIHFVASKQMYFRCRSPEASTAQTSSKNCKRLSNSTKPLLTLMSTYTHKLLVKPLIHQAL